MEDNNISSKSVEDKDTDVEECEVITIQDEKDKKEEEEEVITLDDQPEVTIDDSSQENIQLLDDSNCIPLVNLAPMSPTRRSESPWMTRRSPIKRKKDNMYRRW